MDREIEYRANALRELSDYTEDIIKQAMEQAGLEKVDISSTRRTIADQARIMYENISRVVANADTEIKTVDQLKTARGWGYAATGRAVEQIYFDNAGKAEAEVRGLMEEKIKALLKQGKKTSRHCADIETFNKYNVLDIPYSSVPGNKRKLFQSKLTAMAKEGPNQLVSKLIVEDKCWHIEIAQKQTAGAGNGKAEEAARSDGTMAFPLAIGTTTEVNDDSVEFFYRHTEREHKGGCFPLGANTLWHGGVHLHASKGSLVHAMADGEIVAARLAESDNDAIGHFGSGNFILLKHRISGKRLNAQFTDETPADQPGSHTVKAGDRLEDLAAEWGTTVHAIRGANPKLEPHFGQNASGTISWYFPGDMVSRPDGAAGPSPSETYTVQKGDKLEDLATEWGTTIKAIRDANPALESNFGQNATKTISWYHPGDTVTRPGAAPNEQASGHTAPAEGHNAPAEKFKPDEEKVFYSLYMHLHNEALDPTANRQLGKFKWLPRVSTESTVDTGETHTIRKGESLQAVAKRWDTTVQAIKEANPNLDGNFGTNGKVSWYHPGDVVKRPAQVKVETHIDQGFLDSLKSGDIIKLADVPVKTGQPLWTSGTAGDEGAMIHWEIFSDENLLPSFVATEDTDEDFNMDVESIFAMVDQDDNFEDRKNISEKEVNQFYQHNPDAAKLRGYSCRFVSEWAMDVDKVVEGMKGRFRSGGLKEKLEFYVWWDKARDKGVQLPSDKHTWHYNPISFVSKLNGPTRIYLGDYIVDHIPAASPRRPGHPMTPKYLTIHSTGNAKSTANGERGWLTNPDNDRVAGYHLVVDENKAIECIPLTENAWHAGDGGSGTGNTQSIGLEIVESGDREKTLRNAIRLAAQILVEHGLAIDNMKRHKDWSGKHCPRILLSPTDHEGQSHQDWEWFKKEVKALL